MENIEHIRVIIGYFPECATAVTALTYGGMVAFWGLCLLLLARR